MLGYSPAPAAAGALVWKVSEPMRLRARQPRAAQRARRRGLSRVVAQVERSAEYRRSLGELHALASSFQSGLEPSQREGWLALEEALLAHTDRLNRVYYRAGFRHAVEWCRRSPQATRRAEPPSERRSSARRERAAPAAHRDAARGEPDVARAEARAVVTAGAELVAALARLLAALAQR